VRQPPPQHVQQPPQVVHPDVVGACSVTGGKTLHLSAGNAERHRACVPGLHGLTAAQRAQHTSCCHGRPSGGSSPTAPADSCDWSVSESKGCRTCAVEVAAGYQEVVVRPEVPLGLLLLLVLLLFPFPLLMPLPLLLCSLPVSSCLVRCLRSGHIQHSKRHFLFGGMALKQACTRAPPPDTPCRATAPMRRRQG
jgi:hypothetical protein